MLSSSEQASLSSATSDSTLPNYRKAKHQTGSQAKRCLKNTGDTYAKLDSDKNDSNSPIPEPDQGSGLDTPPPAESSPYPGPTPDPVPDPSTPDLACAKPIGELSLGAFQKQLASVLYTWPAQCCSAAALCSLLLLYDVSGTAANGYATVDGYCDQHVYCSTLQADLVACHCIPNMEDLRLSALRIYLA